jgi:hypothetical protein
MVKQQVNTNTDKREVLIYVCSMLMSVAQDSTVSNEGIINNEFVRKWKQS